MRGFVADVPSQSLPIRHCLKLGRALTSHDLKVYNLALAVIAKPDGPEVGLPMVASFVRKCRRGKPFLGSIESGCSGFCSIGVVPPMFNSFSTLYRHYQPSTFCARRERRHFQRHQDAAPYKVALKLMADAIFGAYQHPISVQMTLFPPEKSELLHSRSLLS